MSAIAIAVLSLFSLGVGLNTTSVVLAGRG